MNGIVKREMIVEIGYILTRAMIAKIEGVMKKIQINYSGIRHGYDAYYIYELVSYVLKIIRPINIANFFYFTRKFENLSEYDYRIMLAIVKNANRSRSMNSRWIYKLLSDNDIIITTIFVGFILEYFRSDYSFKLRIYDGGQLLEVVVKNLSLLFDFMTRAAQAEEKKKMVIKQALNDFESCRTLRISPRRKMYRRRTLKN